MYLETLNFPEEAAKAVSKQYNVRESDGGYVIVDAWKEEGGTQRQELYYRHDPDADPTIEEQDKMNPASDFDLWSLGPDGEGGPTGTKEQRADDLDNW